MNVVASKVILFVVFATLVQISQQFDFIVGSSQFFNYHALTFPFPKNGETLMANNCNSEKCEASITILGYYKNFINVQELSEYKLSIRSEGNVLSEFMVSLFMGGYTLLTTTVTIPDYEVYLPLTISMHETNSNLLVFENNVTMTFVLPKDFGISKEVPQCLQSTDSPSALDFIEIGTSNYDTATQAAEMLMKSSRQVIRGVAVEVVRQYLTALPNLPGVTKVNAAITLSEFDDVATVFFIPESIIDKKQLNFYYKGCTSVNTIDINIIQALVQNEILPINVQKVYVPSLTIGQLIEQHVQPGQRLRLLKTDMEGMDQSVVDQMVDHYESRTGSSEITPEYPCVVFFETKKNGISNRDPILTDKLTNIGYREYRGFYEEGAPSIFDAMIINCQCSVEDVQMALLLLYPSIFDFNDVWSIC